MNESRKASWFHDPIKSYIHGLLSRAIGGQSDNTGVITGSNLLMLYIIIKRYSINLGHLLADLVMYKWTFASLKSIFVGPYITSMIRGMGLIAHTWGMCIISGTTPLGMSTLFSMGLVEKHDNIIILIQYSIMGECIIDH